MFIFPLHWRNSHPQSKQRRTKLISVCIVHPSRFHAFVIFHFLESRWFVNPSRPRDRQALCPVEKITFLLMPIKLDDRDFLNMILQFAFRDHRGYTHQKKIGVSIQSNPSLIHNNAIIHDWSVLILFLQVHNIFSYCPTSETMLVLRYLNFISQ